MTKRNRICAACAADHGVDGPRPLDSHIKLELQYACSTSCAVKLGWLP